MKFRSMLPRIWQEEPQSLQSLRRDVDKLFESWLGEFGVPEIAWGKSDFRPRIDVVETEKAVQISAELPGVEEKDIEVSVAGEQLVIRGEKKSEVDEKSDKDGQAVHRVERLFGSFQRVTTLPFAIDPDKVQASFKDGVLRLTIAKPAEVQKVAKKIAISGDNPAATKKVA